MNLMMPSMLFTMLKRARIGSASLFFMLMLSASPIAAQSSAPFAPATDTVADSALQVAREDTTYALQRLFHESRRRYGIQAVMRGAGFGYFGYRTSQAFRQSDNTEKRVVNVIAITAFGYLFTRSAINLYRYRSGREKKLLATLEQGRALPYKVRKKFNASYFDTPTTSQ